ncbi:hypothetical protein HanRHA438_Chr09g0393571 [Helianthus annuus]|nr:hypothetical protein HanRHA438_Chr09g0393571 [Helianthus annuus]
MDPSKQSLLNKGGRKKEDIGEEHGGDIMALEFNRVALDVTGERSLIREKVVMLVNVSSVMPCDMLRSWCFFYSG